MDALTLARGARWKPPAWVAVAAVVVGLLAGIAIGRGAEPGPAPLRAGIVTSIEDEAVCVARPDGSDNECYQAPGLTVRPGEAIRYLVGTAPVDAGDLGKGTQQVLTYVAAN